MRNFATAIAAVSLALIASTPAFAGGSRKGGPDTDNPVPHVAVAANGPMIQVWGGKGLETRPTVSADAVTGGTLELVATYNVGRLTYRVFKTHQADENGNQLASDEYVVFVNG